MDGLSEQIRSDVRVGNFGWGSAQSTVDNPIKRASKYPNIRPRLRSNTRLEFSESTLSLQSQNGVLSFTPFCLYSDLCCSLFSFLWFLPTMFKFALFLVHALGKWPFSGSLTCFILFSFFFSIWSFPQQSQKCVVRKKLIGRYTRAVCFAAKRIVKRTITMIPIVDDLNWSIYYTYLGNIWQ